jgi:hypothetical protein
MIGEDVMAGDLSVLSLLLLIAQHGRYDALVTRLADGVSKSVWTGTVLVFVSI